MITKQEWNHVDTQLDFIIAKLIETTNKDYSEKELKYLISFQYKSIVLGRLLDSILS